MFCGNIFTSTDLQNHKKIHMKKSPKRFHLVNRASFLSLSNEFEYQKLIPKISPKKIWSAPCFPKIVCGGQCDILLEHHQENHYSSDMSRIIKLNWPFPAS